MKKLMMPIIFAFLCLNTMANDYYETFPQNMRLKSQGLELKGTGTRVKMLMDMYTLGLYVKDVNMDASPIVSDNKASVIRLSIISRFVTPEKLIKAIQVGFERSTLGNTAPIQAGIDIIAALVRHNGIDKKDIFQFAYHPDTGTTVSKNGKHLANIEGYEFKKALWGVWFGSDPIDKKLKARLFKN